MGPSHFFVLLLAISACAYGMLPNAGKAGYGAMMSNVGLPGRMSQARFPGTISELSMTSGLGMTGGHTMPGGQGMTSGQSMTSGLGMTGGLTMPGGKVMTSGKSMTSGLGMIGGQGMTGGVSMTGGQPMGRGGRSGAMLAMQYPLYEWKRNQLKNLIKLYEKHGCVDPMQKFSSEFLPAAVTMISGCSHVLANTSCRQYGAQKVNLQTVLFQNSMSPSYQSLMAGRMQNMSPYNSLKDYILGTVPQTQMNPAYFRMVFGNEGAGSGLAFTGERLDRLKNMRMRFLPYQCQDVRHGSLNMGMCCPGPDPLATAQQAGGANAATAPDPSKGTATTPTGNNAYPDPNAYSQAQTAASGTYGPHQAASTGYSPYSQMSPNSVHQPQSSPQLMYAQAQLQAQAAMYGPKPSGYGQQQQQQQQQQAPMYGQQPGYSQQPSLYSQQQSPQYGQKVSPYGQQASPYGQQASPYGQSPSQYGQSPSQYGQQASPYGQRSSLHGQQYSSYGQQPRYTQTYRSPQYGQYGNQYGQSWQYNPHTPWRRNPWDVPQWQRQTGLLGNGPMGYGQRGNRPMGNGQTGQHGQRGQQGSKRRVPKNPLIGNMHVRQLKWKENMNQNLVSHYKNKYGCREALNAIPNNIRFNFAEDFLRGCGPQANNSCGLTTMKRNPAVYINRQILPANRLTQIEKALNAMDLYTMASEVQRSQRRMGGVGAAGSRGGTSAMSGAGAFASALAGMPGMGGRSMGRMGAGAALGTAFMFREIAGMELSDAREKYLPFVCQEIGTSPQTKIGMCCPGAVDILRPHQTAILMGMA